MGVNQKVVDSLPLLTTRGVFLLGVATTITGNVPSIAALRANLEHVMADEAFDRMHSGAKQMANGIASIIKDNDLPWHVEHSANQVYYHFSPGKGEKTPEPDEEWDELIHLYFTNRGVFLGPKACWPLISPETTAEDVDFHNKVLSEFVNDLINERVLVESSGDE